jgi:hypothetical protein
MYEGDSIWTKKGGTLSDKSAQKEFGLTQEEIYEAVSEGKLQYRENYIHGNPYLRLLRHEVIRFVEQKYGKDHLDRKQHQHELKEINKQLRSLNTQIKTLEMQKIKLMKLLGETK